MARIRTIKPSFWKDEDLGGLSAYTRLCFIGLWNFADVDGRLKDSPIRLKVEIFPYDEDITSAVINNMLDSLSDKGFIMRYKDHSETPVIQVVNWKKHQRITGTEASMESSFGAPDGMETQRKQLGNTLETQRKQLGNTTENGKFQPENQVAPGKTHDKKEECVQSEVSDPEKSQSPNNQQVEDEETTWKQLGNNSETTRTTGREGKGREYNTLSSGNKGLGNEGKEELIEKNTYIVGVKNFSHEENSECEFSEDPPPPKQKRRKPVLSETIEEKAQFAWDTAACQFSEKFRDVWLKLLSRDNWCDKDAISLEIALEQLMEFEEDFAIEQVKLTIVNNWKACVYPETQQRYKEYQKSKSVTNNGSTKCNNANGLGGANNEAAFAYIDGLYSVSGSKGHA